MIHLLTGISPVDLPHKDSQIQFSDKVNVANYFVYWLEKATNISIEKRFQTAQEALNFLHNQQNTDLIPKSDNFRNKLKQPDYSRFIINQTDNQLFLYLPSKIGSKMENTRLFVTLFVLGIITLTFFPLSLLVLLFVYWYCQDMKVVLLEQSFKIQRTIFGFTHQSINGSINDIVGIFLCEGSHEGSKNHSVKIRTKKRSYTIGENLKEEECFWLAKEIQDWLYYHGD